MAVRQIIEIDQELCDGCGDCVSACAEGAIQLIDGKATLVKDSYCDGLGACLGDCHTGAITIIEREADGFDEKAVAAHLEKIGRAPAPKQVLPALEMIKPTVTGPGGGCPGSAARTFNPPAAERGESSGEEASQLRHWPVQLHLVSPTAPFLSEADLLLAADCVPFAAAGFHRRFLAGHSLAIACPKLDANQHVYLDKLVTMIDETKIRSIHIMVMEVPCCGGLVRLVRQAVAQTSRSVPVRCTVIATDGGVKQELDLV